MKRTLSIVIVNWNTGGLLRDCCQSIFASNLSNVSLCEVVIIDNGSTDGSALGLEFASAPLLVVHNKVNIGFASACNQGAERASADLILFLNPDTRLFANTLAEAVGYMASSESADVGICGVRLEDSTGEFATSYAHFPSPVSILRGALGLLSRKPAPLEQGGSSKGPVEVDQVIGAFFLMRKSLFLQLKGFDERFFVYFEEVDLSLRASQSGWRSVCLPWVSAFHFGGGSTQQVKAHRLFYAMRSRMLYAGKHFPFGGFVLVVFATLLVEPLSRSSLSILRRSWASVRETWAGYLMLWQWIPRWLLRGVTR